MYDGFQKTKLYNKGKKTTNYQNNNNKGGNTDDDNELLNLDDSIFGFEFNVIDLMQ